MKRTIKKIATILMSAVMLNTLSNVYAAENLVKNGDFFEKGDANRQAKDWTSSSWWQWQWKENVGIDGTPGMHLTATKTGYQTLRQDIAVEKNTDYVLSYYYKQPDPGHTFQLTGLTQNEAIISEQWLRGVLTDWTKAEYTFNSGENENIRIVLKQMCDVGGDKAVADVYVDDISLYARRPEITDISVSGYASVKESMTVYSKSIDSFGDSIKEPEYNWQFSEDGEEWTDIEGATEKTYEISEKIAGLYLRVQVTPVSEGKDGKVRLGKAEVSKTFKVSEMKADFPIDISVYFNEKLIADESELNGAIVLDKAGIEKAIGESNALIYDEIPYVFELNAENRGISSNVDEDLVIELKNEYLSSLSFAYAYSSAPAGEQSAIIKYNDGTTEEFVYSAGLIAEKSESAINQDAFGLFEEDGTKEADKGYIYSNKLEMGKIAGIESITFPASKTEGKLIVYALSGERVDKEVIREKIEAEILNIPENIKPTDFGALDSIEESAKTYELLGGNVSDISGFDLERFAELRCTAVLNAYNDGDLELIFNSENGFLYDDLLGFSELNSDDVTIYSLYENLLSEEGKKAVQKELVNKDFESVSDLHEELLRNIILKAIQFPNVGGVEYISDILTEENTEKVGLSAEKYFSAEDKSAIHKVVARGSYNSFAELEKDLVPALKKKPSKGSGGSGGGGSIGIIPAVTQKPAEENKEENKQEDKEETKTELEEIQNNPTELIMFKDVDGEHWAYKPIYRLKDLEIVSGKSEDYFDPDGYVTREEFVKMLCLAFEIEGDSSVKTDFSDVKSGAWYESYINTAYSKGIVAGTSENRFGIGIELTRQDLCVMAVRVKGLEENAGNAIDFADSEAIAEYAKGAVSYLVKSGVVNGFTDNTFRPEEKCTRAQAAKVVYELMEIWRDE